MTVASVQGNVLRGYNNDHAHYLFARVQDAGAARGWLTDRLGDVTLHVDADRQQTLNLGFTHAGLLALGVPAIRLEPRTAFSAGMRARADLLGDARDSSPENWDRGLRGDAQVLVTLTAATGEGLSGALAKLHATLPASGLGVVHEQAAAALPDAREHFGFEDGFSQPAIAGVQTGPRDGEGALTRWRRWRDIALGEFVLGHRDEGGMPSRAPHGPLGDDATYMVVRKLEQDVVAFRRYTREAAARLGREPDWVAAKLIGRWPNGSSLVRHPDRPGPAASRDRSDVNRFRYGDDPDGLRCPLGAHVRRANPRDALGWQGRLSMRHRIIRRGMSYGPPLGAGDETGDAHERGLMFICYCASIERQFEFIQRQWLGDGNVFGLGAEADPLASGRDGGASMLVSGHPPRFLTGLPSFVTVRGGDYFLAPGIGGLRALAAGAC